MHIYTYNMLVKLRPSITFLHAHAWYIAVSVIGAIHEVSRHDSETSQVGVKRSGDRCRASKEINDLLKIFRQRRFKPNVLFAIRMQKMQFHRMKQLVGEMSHPADELGF